MLVAASSAEADRIKDDIPQYLFYVVLTPETELTASFSVGKIVWTPAALNLPARVRLALRGKIASRITPDTVEDDYGNTLLS